MPSEDNHEHTLDAGTALRQLDGLTRSERQCNRWVTFALRTVCGMATLALLLTGRLGRERPGVVVGLAVILGQLFGLYASSVLLEHRRLGLQWRRLVESRAWTRRRPYRCSCRSSGLTLGL